ncbi:Tetratricopeptide TPR_2 repeat protein [Gloeothece citriformis PCC 7424]|uniref:Tetratricopeptide TPR_2 repeat protein n=1 Tax=Gloeothece citriformis (strain PCC 7424) TaxID=65393 RepID=B7K9G2_GLOC7|nr:tetratricopeptide repeat protein [Gloeothece citriformis]ACK68645.1 Tetratricopeptide TPR_2 repeat protein [Gloeothece citriformis PCC 7424]
MDDSTLDKLLQDLKDQNEAVRDAATAELWRIWFTQKGELGLELLNRAQFLLEMGQSDQAEATLTQIIHNYPDFAEAWNRRAVLYYLQKCYEQSKQDCEQVIRLNPHHFGAWHGLGLCQAALGNYTKAIEAFRKALDIQPYALINQKLILECTAMMS